MGGERGGPAYKNQQTGGGGSESKQRRILELYVPYDLQTHWVIHSKGLFVFRLSVIRPGCNNWQQATDRLTGCTRKAGSLRARDWNMKLDAGANYSSQSRVAKELFVVESGATLAGVFTAYSPPLSHCIVVEMWTERKCPDSRNYSLHPNDMTISHLHYFPKQCIKPWLLEMCCNLGEIFCHLRFRDYGSSHCILQLTFYSKYRLKISDYTHLPL